MPSLSQLHGPAPTGRESWQQALTALVAPALDAAALGPDRQPVRATNHDPGATWFELIIRPLWGLAAHAAGGGRAPEQWEAARTALTAALDPDHPWYIGPPTPRDQRLVESAGLGFALALAPDQLWDPLTGRQRDHVAGWLAEAQRCETVDNNWHFFPVLAGMGLDRVGADAGRDLAAARASDRAHLDRIESFAMADGWYSDGPHGNARDYYTAFAIHWYGLLHRTLTDWDAERGERFAERSTAFARQFRNWFAADGAAVPFGRSQGYRFAQGAFWGGLAYADLPALPWDEVRGLAERHLGWWWGHPVAGEDGLLGTGYAYPNSAVVEQYLAGGSSYWCTKFFLPLAAPAGHPFWTSAPAPAPAGPAAQDQPAPAAVLARDPGGAVTLLGGQEWHPGMRSGQAKYAKFAYSTRAGFSISLGDRGLADAAHDSMLALSDDDGQRWRGREDAESSTVADGVLHTRWTPWPDVAVDTWLAAAGPGHVRVHRVVTGRRLESAEGGFCAPWTSRGRAAEPAAAADGLAWARGTQQPGGPVHSEIGDVAAAPATGREAALVHPMPGTNVLFPRTVLPTLRGGHGPGEHWLACTVAAAAEQPSDAERETLRAAAEQLLGRAAKEAAQDAAGAANGAAAAAG